MFIPSEDDPAYTVGSAAAMFGVKSTTFRTWIKEGKVNAFKINGRWRVLKSELERLADHEYGD